VSRAGLRFDADHGVTTEALIFLGELDPEAIGPNLEYATHYEPTPVADIDRLLDAVPLDPARATLVDVGAGLSRVVLHAAKRPFRQIVGVEISAALLETAKENRAAYRGPLACRDIRLVCADAARFTFPRGDLVVYLYNPFRAEVLGPLLDRLAEDIRRTVVLVYHTPVERATVDAHPAFELVAEAGPGVLYRTRREVHAGRRMIGRT
jgi:pimeloyl-ACP methyl ester carboxylesterase